MKKCLFMLLLLAGSVTAHADEAIKFVNADGSPFGELCIAAATSQEAMEAKASELGIHHTDIDSIYCNSKTIRKFASQFHAAGEVITAYVVSAANETPETLICLAALTSDDEFARLKKAHFGAVKDVENEIQCNNMSLGQFVRKYREHLADKAVIATASR
jgi:hypothetical protein